MFRKSVDLTELLVKSTKKTCYPVSTEIFVNITDSFSAWIFFYNSLLQRLICQQLNIFNVLYLMGKNCIFS